MINVNSREIQVLHLESSDVCQAACPQCSRETDRTFDRSQRHNLTVDQLQNLLPREFVTNLRKMFMCGNYGDPAANQQSLEIYQWFRDINPGIVLGMNTNGGLQHQDWWSRLADIMHQPQDYVVFSIDGLEDTNDRYRVGVNWSRLMCNVESFISAGGSAHWDMLVYRHNEHQVDACEKLARDLGFRWFRAKVSRRPLVGSLLLPLNWQSPAQISESISCHALRELSIYIDAQARVHPCCWLGGRQRDFVLDFGAVQQSWHSDTPEPVCLRACGTKNAVSNFIQQWQRETQLSR